MALRPDTRAGTAITSDAIYRITTTPNTTTWSASMWVYRVANSIDPYQMICSMRNTGYNAWLGCYINSGNLIWSDSSGDNIGSAMALGQWYHLGISKSSGVVQIYLDGTLVINLTGRPNPTVDGLSMGNVGGFGIALSNEHFNGRYAAIKIWSGVALTANHLSNESRFYLPINPTNLFYLNPGLQNSPNDRSGNANNFTFVGTMALEDNPPIAWMPRPARQAAPIGGTPPGPTPAQAGMLWYRYAS